MQIKSDKEQILLRAVAAGDQQAFKQLFDEYWDNIYGVAFTLTRSREMARDMVQEIFVRLWLMRETLEEKDNFRNFLFIVARNHIFSELRKKAASLLLWRNWKSISAKVLFMPIIPLCIKNLLHC